MREGAAAGLAARPLDVRRRTTPHTANARAHVYARLRRAIVRLEFAPGQALSENELAARFGVSRTPVRESVIRLADEGLIDVVPQLGTFVARISVRDVLEHQFIRELLERGSLPEAMANVTDDDEAKLRELLIEQARAGDEGDVSRWFETDQALHRALLEIAGHTRMWTIVSSARAHLDRVRWLSLPDPGLLSALLAQHQAIVDDVISRDLAAADDALQHHLRVVLEVLDPLRERFPDYFDLDAVDHDARPGVTER